MRENPTNSRPNERDVLVSIPTHDDDGKPITDDMLSTGGARAHGPLVKQYRNPRPVPTVPSLADEAQAREARLLEIREERQLEEIRARRDADAQDFARWFYREVLSPLGKWWWTRRGPEDLTRVRTFAAKHLQRAKLPEEHESASQTEVLAEPVLGPIEDAPAARIVDLGSYRRSA